MNDYLVSLSKNDIYVSKVLKANSHLEFLFFLKEALINNIKFVEVTRSQVSFPEKYSSVLNNEHYYYVTEDGIAYAILCTKYYSDTLFSELRKISTTSYFEYIANNAVYIDKLYKMKAFL